MKNQIKQKVTTILNIFVKYCIIYITFCQSVYEIIKPFLVKFFKLGIIKRLGQVTAWIFQGAIAIILIIGGVIVFIAWLIASIVFAILLVIFEVVMFPFYCLVWLLSGKFYSNKINSFFWKETPVFNILD